MLVLVEKPFVASVVHSVLSQLFPEDELQYLVASPFGLPFSFDYPSKLSWHSYPLWLDAKYKLSPQMQSGCSWQSGRLVRTSVDYTELSPQAVISIRDSHASSVLAGERLVRHLSALGKVTEWLGHRCLRSMVERDVERDIRSRVPEDQTLAYCEVGQLKADFEYSFLVNAAGLLTRSYHSAGGQAASPVFSKYTVQILYALRRAGTVSEDEFIHSLERWSGTGKYANRAPTIRTSLGSAASRDTLLDTLKALSLASVVELEGRTVAGHARRGLRVTELGERFLRRLHPDCEDPDLPFRLEGWLAAPQNNRPSAQRYIRTWFGKQKRFMG